MSYALNPIILDKPFIGLEKILNEKDLVNKINKEDTKKNGRGFHAIALSELKTVKQQATELVAEKLRKQPYLAPSSLSAYTLINDRILRSIAQLVLEKMFPLVSPTKGESISVIAVGGYGRAEMAPYSDVDLLFLTPYKQTAWGENVIESILYLLWDLSLKVGYSVRNVEESIRLAKSDITIRTTLLENRFIFGESKLARELNTRLWSEVFKNTASEFISEKLKERDLRHKKQGSERYLLEPNIKEGKGGLRDLQNLYWISKYVYKIEHKKDLIGFNIFSADDLTLFSKAENFFWTVRCALHLLSDRANENLSFDVQVPIAKSLGFKNTGGLLGVEKFMQNYFLHAKNVGELTRILLARMESQHVKEKPNILNKIKKKFESADTNIEKGFSLTHGRLNVENSEIFVKDPINLIKLFQNGLKSSRLIHPNALHLVARNIDLVDENFIKSEEATTIFLDLLLNYGDPERALRRMNEVGFLGKFIPEFERIVGMMQFNMYHKYTVDEHTIQCIKTLAQIEEGSLREDLPLASKILADGVNRKVLYLTLLLHDIGKGLPEDHSLAGSQIAKLVTSRLSFDKEERELTSWLIRNHLLMSDIAQKRDLSDPKTIKDFASIVKSANRLRLLTVLTVCDIRGVGPDVWNNWKAVMLRTLFAKTINVLKENFEAISRPEQVVHAKYALRKALIEWPEDKIHEEINRHYTGFYLGLNCETQSVFATLGRKKGNEEIISKIEKDASRDATRACFLMEDHPGLFARLAGAIALAGANVIDARTYTTADGYATAVFWLQSKTSTPFEESRLNHLNQTIRNALKGEIIPRDALKERGKIRKKEKDFKVPTNITFDNEGSEIYTIIEIDTRDRLGLLHDLARTLTNNYITIASAIIATYGEQAVDTFYVKDLFGLKLYSENKRIKLAEKLKDAVEAGTLIGAQ